MVKDAALGSQRSWVRIPPPPLGPKSDRGGHECCEADFGSRIKILGHPLGQSASFFEIYPFRLGSVWGHVGARNITPLGSGGAASNRVTHKAALCSLVRPWARTVFGRTIFLLNIVTLRVFAVDPNLS